MKRIHSGNPAVDAILGGGFPARSIHVLMGAPGTGKTILAEQLAFHMATPERPALYVSTLSEPEAKLIQFLQTQGFADPLRIGVDVVYETLAPQLISDPTKLADWMLELIGRHRPSVTIIDSLKAVNDLMPDPATWRRALYELAGVLSAYDTTSFWVGEYTANMVNDLPEFAVADGIVELTREAWGRGENRFLRVMKLRGSDFLRGQHAFRITSDGLEVFPRLVSPQEAPSYAPLAERVPTGIAGLDTMVEHGWLRGTTTLVSGPSGSGKTVLGLHFLREGVQAGESAIFLNFQESPTQLARLLTSFRWSPEFLLGAGKLEHLYYSPVELQVDVLVPELFRRIQASGTTRVVIDAMGDIAVNAGTGMPFRDFIYALTQTFARMNVTSMLLVEQLPGQVPLGGVGQEVSYMSDNTLLLGLDLRGPLRRTVRVVKSRGSAHAARARLLEISDHGMAVGDSVADPEER